MDHTSPLSGLKRPEQYRSERTNVFPSDQSLNWYVRQNRKGLEASGALLRIAGKLCVDPPKFDEYVLDAGRRQRGAA